MKKTVILVLLATLSILGLILHQPIKIVISLLILIPLIIYVIVDIVKYGNNYMTLLDPYIHLFFLCTIKSEIHKKVNNIYFTNSRVDIL